MKEALKKFVNTGVIPLGDVDGACKSQHKTIVVVGVARGGTSMIAGVLFHMGVFMGKKACPPVFEDVHLANAIETGDIQEIRNIISEYNDRNHIWGFKRPSIIDHLDIMHHEFLNPIYIFVFKDMAAIANRNVLSMGFEFTDMLNRAHKDYGKIIDFISNQENLNGYVVSYEKAMVYKEQFVMQLKNIVGNSGGKVGLNEAVSFINREPALYLDKSRIID